MPKLEFDRFSLIVPEGWNEITEAVDGTNPPYTLAHSDGVGALQFSVALYLSGQAPSASQAALLHMLKTFGREQGLEEPSHVSTEPGPPILATGTFRWDDDFLRVWQISDGNSFAFVTYTCSADHVGPELAVSELIVRSIEFRSR